MAIKPRRQPTPADIEAFGDAADKPVPRSEPAPEPTPEPPAPPSTRGGQAAARPTGASTAWPDGVARTLTLRYPDPSIPQLLAALAEADERSQHNTAVRALRRGLEELQREAGL